MAIYDDQILRDARKNRGRVSSTGGGGTQMHQHWDEGAEESSATPWIDPNKSKGPSTPIGQALIFPTDLGTSAEQQNFMMFYPKKISGGKGNAREITFTDLQGYPAVALPIPSGLNTSYTQSWSQAQVAGRNSMLADKGGDVIRRMSQALQPSDPLEKDKVAQTRITDILSRLTEGLGEGAGGAMDRALGNISSADWWNRAAGGVATEMAAMVAAGPAEGLATASQYNVGMRAVQQTMMSYGGPGFRSFTYTFSLKPMRVVESQIVFGITKLFKELSAPNQQATRYTRVYDLPAVFKIMFYNGGQENPYIAKVGHCALTSIGITYGGGKFSTFHETHAPVQTDITLNFQEMELLNRQMLEYENIGGSDWPSHRSAHRALTGGDFTSGEGWE